MFHLCLSGIKTSSLTKKLVFLFLLHFCIIMPSVYVISSAWKNSSIALFKCYPLFTNSSRQLLAQHPFKNLLYTYLVKHGSVVFQYVWHHAHLELNLSPFWRRDFVSSLLPSSQYKTGHIMFSERMNHETNTWTIIEWMKHQLKLLDFLSSRWESMEHFLHNSNDNEWFSRNPMILPSDFRYCQNKNLLI